MESDQFFDLLDQLPEEVKDRLVSAMLVITEISGVPQDKLYKLIYQYLGNKIDLLTNERLL